MSAGGQFSAGFVAWKAERVAAFIVNKGGIYYSALVSKAARDVPKHSLRRRKDLEFHEYHRRSLCRQSPRRRALGARAGASAAHVVARSRDLGAILFEEVLPLRLPDAIASSGPVALKAIDPKSGFIGDLKAMTTKPIAEAGTLSGPTAWLPTARLARGWVAVVTGAPFDQ
jgi:hypothetical protein